VANDNKITLLIDTIVDSNQATGKVEGSFKSPYTCTIDSGGKATMTR
jgi:hypothetical protein